jgi:hypothetical protein
MIRHTIGSLQIFRFLNVLTLPLKKYIITAGGPSENISKKRLKVFVFTEFITPVNHAGKYNTVSSALGHHIYELRWLHNQQYLDDYISFWLYVDPKTPKPHLHAFSSWLQNAMYNRYLVNLDKAFIKKKYPCAKYRLHAMGRRKRIAFRIVLAV